jgi:hypothetical protein
MNFASRIYVKEKESNKLKLGSKYILKPMELIGRIASKSVVDGGNVVSALHCGPATSDILYSIHEVATTIGGKRRKTRSKKKKLRKTRKH